MNPRKKVKMKKYISILINSIFLLPSSILVYSQDENYDAVYLQLKKEYTYNPDGSMDYRYIKKQKLQTYRSFNNLYGETFIVYNPDFQTLKVNEVYTIMADGKKNPSPANAFNEVLPGFAANAPAYNKLREMVITHAGTERNAVLNLDYVLHSKKGFYPCLMGNELLCEVEPVKELTFIIRVPSESRLNYSVLNSSAIPVITKDGNLQVYTWEFTNVPAISTEDFQKGGNDLYRSVTRNLLSTATPEVEEQFLMSDVQTLQFSCFDGTQWQDTWDTTMTNSNLPVAVRVTIQLAGAAVTEPIQMVVPVVAQSRTNKIIALSSAGT